MRPSASKKKSRRVFSACGKGYSITLAVAGSSRPYVHVFGRVPHHAGAIDAERVGRGLRTGELELRDCARLGVEAADLAGVEFREPHDALVVDLDAARPAVLGR